MLTCKDFMSPPGLPGELTGSVPHREIRNSRMLNNVHKRAVTCALSTVRRLWPGCEKESRRRIEHDEAPGRMERNAARRFDPRLGSAEHLLQLRQRRFQLLAGDGQRRCQPDRRAMGVLD